jgi:hypothetical protein
MPQSVASCAVRSYRTLSPLPVSKYDHRRYAFCCTFRRLAPPRSYLALCPMEPGLSSPVNPIPPKEISRKTAVAAQPTPRIDYHEIISCLKIIFIKISLKVAKKFSRLTLAWPQQCLDLFLRDEPLLIQQLSRLFVGFYLLLPALKLSSEIQTKKSHRFLLIL